MTEHTPGAIAVAFTEAWSSHALTSRRQPRAARLAAQPDWLRMRSPRAHPWGQSRGRCNDRRPGGLRSRPRTSSRTGRRGH
jgi:hypothetical protein